MYWQCMIATFALATGNKLDCFISARGMLTIVWLVCCCFVVVYLLCVFVDFYMLINHLLKKNTKYTRMIIYYKYGSTV